MKGNQKIIDKLNTLLTAELTSIDSYFVHSRVLKNKGYTKLYEQLNHEMEDEQGHAAAVIERIIFLEGTPLVHDRLPFEIEDSVKGMFESDLKFEHIVRNHLIELIELCMKEKDYVTKEKNGASAYRY